MTILDRLSIQNILYNMDTYRLFFKSMLNIVDEEQLRVGCGLHVSKIGQDAEQSTLRFMKKDNHEC